MNRNSKLGITISNDMIKYIINEDTGTVVAVVSGNDVAHSWNFHPSILRDFIRTATGQFYKFNNHHDADFDLQCVLENAIIHIMKSVNVYKGIAKCAAPDEFDESIGRSIAKRKVLRKIYNKYAQILHQLQSMFILLAKGIQDAESDVDNQIYEIDDYLSKR